MSKKQKQVVVLGQRRSGTSMVAGILYYLGIPMGKEATPKQTSERNPNGFFEDRSFVQLSQRILGYVKQKQYGGNPLTAANIEYKFDDEIKKVVKAREKDGDIWGVKDVNQLQVHKFFKKYFDNPYYISVFRNPIDTSHSMFDWHGKRHKLPYETYLQQAIDNNKLMLKLMGILKGELMVFSYDRALRNPKETVENVIKFLDISPTDKQKNDAINHIKEPMKYGKK